MKENNPVRFDTEQRYDNYRKGSSQEGEGVYNSTQVVGPVMRRAAASLAGHQAEQIKKTKPKVNNYQEFEEMLDCQMTNRGVDYEKRSTVQKTADEGIITGAQDGHNGEANQNNMNKNNERFGQGHNRATYGTGAPQRSYSSKQPTSY